MESIDTFQAAEDALAAPYHAVGMVAGMVADQEPEEKNVAVREEVRGEEEAEEDF